MKFVCLGYIDEAKWGEMSENEQSAFINECFTYDDELRRGSHFLGGQGLQSSQNAVTLRWQGEQAMVVDGPFSETKEQLGGILFLEARDLNHAITLMSKHPMVRGGAFEIRPADEKINTMIEERSSQSFSS
ncbi:YCII-related domain protein [Gimesia aquarii]|uniref:YCII-related domain protein n=2 Tax=Gimesia aquarii TaxID=2527964 RepID=A0A517WXT5_9PLAN|nr:YCII-related domain protein [Gimesia aquarii]